MKNIDKNCTNIIKMCQDILDNDTSNIDEFQVLLARLMIMLTNIRDKGD